MEKGRKTHLRRMASDRVRAIGPRMVIGFARSVCGAARRERERERESD
jgi:hypothetical protein